MDPSKSSQIVRKIPTREIEIRRRIGKSPNNYHPCAAQ
jgi:hypothetical protein